jgi:hypothetical protein
MAIQIALQTSNIGVPFSAAYVRVARFSGDKERVTYSVDIYASAQARADNAQPIGSDRFRAITANVAGDVLPALYADLKARAGYEKAEDC